MKHPEIPSFANKLFHWFCKEAIVEELEGDLEESFLRNKEKHGLRKAQLIYYREVFRMIRPSVVGVKQTSSMHRVALISSYTTIAIRNIKRHKLFSFINIFSLSVAMSTGLLVLGFIGDLMRFDEFHEHKDQLYRVISTPYYQSREFKTQASSPLKMAEEIKAQVPGIEVLQLGRRLDGKALVGGKNVAVQGIYADEKFFDFLSFELVRGNAKTALSDPFSILVSESLVEKVFGGNNVVGESLSIEGLGTFKITGIVKDPPKFSHIQFEVIGSFSTVHALAKAGIFKEHHDNWAFFDRYYTYLRIPDENAKNNVASWLDNVAPTYYPNPDEVTASFELQSITSIIPGPNISDSIGPKMIMLPVIILSIIAAAVLLSAIFNYTNLSMARALKRSREVGIRKLNGATGGAVYLQFTIEAIVLSLLSLGLGILFFRLLRAEFISILPRANDLLELNLSPQLLLAFGGFAIVTGLIAGLAPSLFFSRLSSLRALRVSGTLKTLSKINFRKGLIVGQFTLSMIFLLAIVITYRQYSFSINHDMGFDKENILNIALQGNDPEILETALIELPEVSEISFTSRIPGIGSWDNLQVVDQRNLDSVWVNTMTIDHRFITNLDLELLAGRNFRAGENSLNEQSLIVNETLIQSFDLGAPLDAIGKTINVGGEFLEVIGVVKDFHYTNLEEPIRSFVFRNNYNYQYANVKMSSPDLVKSLDKVDDLWNEIDSKNQLQAQFFDDQVEEYFQYFVDIMKLFGFIAFLAISISCLGLFGMAIYSMEIRMKEISIRKTFGASEKSLIFLLSRGFMKLIAIAIAIGTPIAYLVFDRFILAESFYHTEISFLDVSLSILFLMGLCMLTITTQTWSAARTNPSEILRNE